MYASMIIYYCTVVECYIQMQALLNILSSLIISFSGGNHMILVMLNEIDLTIKSLI